MLVKTFGSAVYGVNAMTIHVEVYITPGLQLCMVGLPDSAVKESQYRIEAAIRNIGLHLPGKKITVNLAPADIRKEGSAYDLPIAIGILAASNQVAQDNLEDFIMMGELSLDGSVQPVKGALPMAIQASKEKFKGLIIPVMNAEEAAVVNTLEVYGVRHLSEVLEILNKEGAHIPVKTDVREAFFQGQSKIIHDFSDVKGQESIKRALEIAAAGGHNAILIGPPGAGKTMLAKRLPTILPPMSVEEALETTKIHSVAGKMSHQKGLISQRPFRAPHHTISDVALVGGGGVPKPGEISLAHNGVLFLDELPEFKRAVLEVLRQPLEDRIITISRAKISLEYPASFMLVASMNPCPCGNFTHPEKACICSSGTVKKYLAKISGPLLDRIDLHVEVTPVSYHQLSDLNPAENSTMIRDRVVRARRIQQERFEENEGIYCNAQMNSRLLRVLCKLDHTGTGLLKNAMEKMQLSARAYDRILKVARTIADLGESQHIKAEHIAEAIQYRSLDREGWAG